MGDRDLEPILTICQKLAGRNTLTQRNRTVGGLPARDRELNGGPRGQYIKLGLATGTRRWLAHEGNAAALTQQGC